MEPVFFPQKPPRPRSEYTHVSAAAVLWDGQGHVLLQEREQKPGVTYPGFWGLFGGGIEAGEEPADAMQRELLEELELSCAVHFIGGVEFDFRAIPSRAALAYRYFFGAVLTDVQIGALVLGEGASMQWFSPNALHRQLSNVLPLELPILSQVAHGLLTPPTLTPDR